MARNRRLMNQINVVPYIDVMLVLLVIFMVTAPMIQTGSVDLPSAAEASGTPDNQLQIEVSANGVFTLLNGAEKVLETDQIEAIISEIKRATAETSRPILIAGDKQTRYEKILGVMSSLQNAGIDKIGLLVQPGNTGPARKK